jgi:hypothetical protein
MGLVKENYVTVDEKNYLTFISNSLPSGFRPYLARLLQRLTELFGAVLCQTGKIE